MIETRPERDRAVSISITHVLTVGITTILIAMLLTSASTMLDIESERSTESALETIGERLADEVGNVDQIADENTTANATVDHPRTAGSSRYTVTLESNCEDSAPLIGTSDTDCLRLTAHSNDVVVYVPIETDAEIDTAGEVPGGQIKIRYDGKISITEADR